MVKELLHTDSLDNVTDHQPIVPVPDAETLKDSVYRKLGIFYAIEAKIAWVMRVILFTSILSLGLLMAAQVFMRYAIASPFLGIEEMAPMLALWTYFVGMAYCSRERDHIEGGVMSLVIQNTRVLVAIRLFGSVVVLVALVIFIFYAWDYASFNLSLNRKSAYMKLPKYLWDFSMLTGFGLMIFYMFLQIFLEARVLVSRKEGQLP